MSFYVGASDGLLHGIDVILSGYPFPEKLKENKPPFGVARFNFTDGIDIQSTGSLQVCTTGKSKDCLSKRKATKNTLYLAADYSATGYFQIGEYTLDS
jgi:hypothetical protein